MESFQDFLLTEVADYEAYLKKYANSKSKKKLMTRTDFNTWKKHNEYWKSLPKKNGIVTGPAPDKAKKKVAEEVEQIDELEKKTVISYLNKADPSQGMRNAEKETPGILKNPNALRQYKKKVKAGVSRALDRLKPKQGMAEAAQIGVGSKVYHPIHGSGKVLKHSTGAGADHWAEVKFLSGNTKRVNRKHLKLEEVESLLEYPSDLAKMKKSDSYKVGDKIYAKVGGAWRKGHVTTPLNKAGNHGIKFEHGGKTHSYVSHPNDLRLHVEEEVVAEDVKPIDLKNYDDKEHKGHYWRPTGKVATDNKSNRTTYEYVRINDDGKKTGDRHYKDEHGKYMGESVEEALNELHKDTIASYLNKAKTNYATQRKRMSRAYYKDVDKYDDATVKSNARKAGIKAAKSRLSEEEVVAEGMDYSVTVKHTKDGKTLDHEYTVKNANDKRHAKNIALQRHEKKIGGLKDGEQISASSNHVKELRNEEVHINEALDPSEIAGNPKMYDAATVKKAFYHKNASESDKQSLARHLDRHHGNKEWRKSVKEESELCPKCGISPCQCDGFAEQKETNMSISFKDFVNMLEEAKCKMKEAEEIETSDYKTDKNGRKHRAHKIVFNKGESKREDDEDDMKEELKGNQHKLDKNKNGKLDAHDFKLLRKENVEQIDEKDELMVRRGINSVNKTPRAGQTNLKDIPAGNRPDSQNKFSDSDKKNQPDRLKAAIKASLGKHSKPNLPEEVEIDEAAKWRSTSVAKKVTDPEGYDSTSYDYHHDYPKSTGMKKATSDTDPKHGSLSARRKAVIASKGDRKGMITKQHANSLKDKIKSSLRNEEVELDEAETIKKDGVTRHKGDYGTSYDGDDNKKPAPTVKRGRGRPKKGSDETGEVKKFDFSALIQKHKIPKFTGKSTVHKMKD